MAKTKISEFSSTPANNTDIDSINIAEGCAPSGINDAIRELMAQLKDFQTGAQGDSFNGPIGTSTAAAGAFTTLSASSTVTLSGGTANGVPYLNGSKVLTSGSALSFDSSLNILSVSGGINSIIGATNPLAGAFTTINASGAVTFASASTLTLSGGIANGVAYLNGSKVVTSGSALTFDGSNLTLTGNLYMTGGSIAFDDERFVYSYAGGSLGQYMSGVYYDGSGLNQRFYINNSEQMRLTSTGLGIGTSSPTTKLSITDSTGPIVRLVRTSNRFELSADTDFMSLNARDASTYITFKTADTERARIDSSGNLLVGTTGQTLGTARLCVSSSGLTTVSTTSTSTESPYASFNTATSGNNQFMWFYTGDSGQTFRGSIEYNRGGGVVAYNTTSDYRLKENIVDLPNALATVAQLKPRQFDWKETGNTTTGFIAHELAEVCPHAVTGEKDAVDEDGNPKYQGIDTSFLVATLTAALQELKAEFDAYKASHP